MTAKVNEFGDKISKSDIYAGIMFWVGLAAVAACVCYRAIQEHHKGKAVKLEKPRTILIQNQR